MSRVFGRLDGLGVLFAFAVALLVCALAGGVAAESGSTATGGVAVESTASDATLEHQQAGGSSEIRLSRSSTVVGTPVTAGLADGSDGAWALVAPAGSDASLRENRGAVTVQPDVTGSYELRAETDGGEYSATFTARERTDLVERFAPRIHFHEDAPYRPTRLEALVENAQLRRGDGDVVDETPTLLDLAGRDDSHYLSLQGSQSEYPEFQQAFDPTVYANHVPNVTFEGETYDVVTYWLVYSFDPKHGFARFGAHQGDVEWVSVLVDDGEGEYVVPATHGGLTIAPYEQWAEDGRLDVYPEHRSHATYLRDSSSFDGNDLQVYEFWSDGSAACDAVATFESTFYSEWTGDAESWHPSTAGDGEGAIEYDVVELTGDEVWASYEGGLAESPGSITPPHDRTEFTDPGASFEGACRDRNKVRGSLSVDSFDLESGEGVAEVTVENSGGVPHEFWVTAETDEVLAAEPVRVGTSRWETVGMTNSTELRFETDTDDLSVELWLHPPETRVDGDREDAVTVEDGTPQESDGLSRWLLVTLGVAGVAAVSYGWERYLTR